MAKSRLATTRILAGCLILALAQLFVATAAVAGGAATAAAQAIAPLAAAIDDADARAQAIAADAHSNTITDAGLRHRIDTIPAIQAQLRETLAALQPRMQATSAKLAELGPAPAGGQPPEDPEVAQERLALLQARKAIDTEIKLGKLVSVEAQQLQDYLVERRRSLFSARLWRRDRSPLDPHFWSEAAGALSGDLARVTTASHRVAGAAQPGRKSSNVVQWVAGLIAALAIGWPLRIVTNKVALDRAQRMLLTRLRCSALAVWLVLVTTLTTLLACMIVRAVIPSDLLQPPVDQLARLLTRAIVFASLFAALGKALLAPSISACRLAPLSDQVALRIRRYPMLIGMVAAAATAVNGATETLGLSEAGSSAFRVLVLIAEIVAIGAALTRARGRGGSLEDAELSRMDGAPTPTQSRLPWVFAALCASFALVAASAATLFGYISLAGFIIGEMIWIATLLGMLFLLVRFVDDGFPALASPHAGPGRFLRDSVGLTPAALEQVGVLLSGAARVALLLFGWAAILAPFGAGAGDVLERLTSADLVFHLGQVAISPGTIVGGLLIFVLAIAITRGVRRWLEVRYLPKTAMDVGAQTALSAGIGYLGAIVAIVIAASYLGLSLDRITLFASALSVGIGFGLQSVISNFVSGLILLAERPVRVGDWIAIGDLEGDVKRISVRATEIEMRDRSRLIVPNSDLISKTVRNVTHSSSLGRLKIVLRVVDNTDPATLRDLVTDCVRNHPAVLAEPAAAIFLTDVRDGALEFTTLAYVASPRDTYRVRSELLFEIVPALRAKGIALASSTPIVNVGVGDRPIEPAPNNPDEATDSQR